MKKNVRKYIIAIAVLLVCYSSLIQAQPQYNNEFTVSLGAGSSALKYKIGENSSKSGLGWQLGGGYSHYFSKNIGFSLGLEAEMFAASVDMGNISFEQQIQTPPGLSGNFLLRANYAGLKEKQTAIMLQIPVMLQFQFPVSESSFFFLGTGVKAGFPVSSKWNQDISGFTTTGFSEYTGQTYADMPNHGFSTYPGQSASGRLELKSPVFFVLEGGLKFGIGVGKYLYTGVFLDYGLNDMYKKPAVNTSLLVYNNDSPADYKHNSVLTADRFSVPDGIKPFAVGIKIKIGLGSGKVYEPVKRLPPKENESIPKQKPDPVWGWEDN